MNARFFSNYLTQKAWAFIFDHPAVNIPYALIDPFLALLLWNENLRRRSFLPPRMMIYLNIFLFNVPHISEFSSRAPRSCFGLESGRRSLPPAPTEEGPHAAAFINLRKKPVWEVRPQSESQNLIADLLQLSAHIPEADEPTLSCRNFALFIFAVQINGKEGAYAPVRASDGTGPDRWWKMILACKLEVYLSLLVQYSAG